MVDRTTPEAAPEASAEPGTEVEVVKKAPKVPYGLLNSVKEDEKWKTIDRLVELPGDDFDPSAHIALKRGDFIKLDFYFEWLAIRHEADAQHCREQAKDIRENGGKSTEAKTKRLDKLTGQMSKLAEELGVDLEELIAKMNPKAEAEG
jgi:hypothetical protein